MSLTKVNATAATLNKEQDRGVNKSIKRYGASPVLTGASACVKSENRHIEVQR